VQNGALRGVAGRCGALRGVANCICVGSSQAIDIETLKACYFSQKFRQKKRLNKSAFFIETSEVY